ncbi:4-(cytidine 5'-diphospho)-2-C-methyl-D-erythritol kinase [Adlercreutzia sp. ZJ154]|uniref:4-(cytidine 5'-diphospho)-2-C-methyl-D-erythritol kinase n=1 Tax=Adlercreutzia sp. ZJ154 TaxID=2709790 RepID=UPI0013E9F14B|nr:4-(cytidine 5'-diphospho)-2-C-methyl-D-erythritol kinase [Adlercreutzia sp. ZJ154]
METLTVDMMAEARNAQWSADTFLGPGALKVIAPAKVNLFLAVGRHRGDGYHDVVNVMHALALHDVLYFHRNAQSWCAPEKLPSHMAAVGPANNLLVNITTADKTQAAIRALDVPASENLVTRALAKLAHAIDYKTFESISIHIEKNIPHQAGLGGGSSDAAAALVAAANMWGLPSDAPVLYEVASSLGADVAFFLQGGCALLSGAGECLKSRLQPAKTPIVLAKPHAGVSTAQAYARFDEDAQFAPSDLLAQVESAKLASEVPLYNNLSSAAEFLVPELVSVREKLEEYLAGDISAAAPSAVCNQVLLCGSGSCTFAITDSFSQASRIAAEARTNGWWARATTLSSLKAAIL